MGRRMRIVAATLAAGALVAAASAAGKAAFERRIAREIADLLASSRGAEPPLLTEADLAPLPEPVRRWLRWSRVVGQARPVTVRLKQEGEFRLSEDRGWMPFAAEQHFTTDPPGFVWSVSMRLAPLVAITGRDRYAAGTADIEMRLLSLIPVASKRGAGLNQGALLRYLGEIGWFPAAAVSPSIAWEGIDAASARATISDCGVSASATFLFDEQGRPVDVVAERYNDTKGRIETWSAATHVYGEFAGARVPVESEAIWRYDTGDFPYVRVRITDVAYNRPNRS